MGYVKGHFGEEENAQPRARKPVKSGERRRRRRRYNRDEYMESGMLGQGLLAKLKGAIKGAVTKGAKSGAENIKSGTISAITTTVLNDPKVQSAMSESAKQQAAEALAQQAEASISKTQAFLKSPQAKYLGWGLAAVAAYLVARQLTKKKSALI